MRLHTLNFSGLHWDEILNHFDSCLLEYFPSERNEKLASPAQLSIYRNDLLKSEASSGAKKNSNILLSLKNSSVSLKDCVCFVKSIHFGGKNALDYTKMTDFYHEMILINPDHIAEHNLQDHKMVLIRLGLLALHLPDYFLSFQEADKGTQEKVVSVRFEFSLSQADAEVATRIIQGILQNYPYGPLPHNDMLKLIFDTFLTTTATSLFGLPRSPSI